MSITRFCPALAFFLFLPVPLVFGQSASENPAPTASNRPAARSACNEVPREDALPFLCAPPSSAVSDSPAAIATAVPIQLVLPAGTALRIAIDQRVRISQPGETVQGRIVDTVYAFDSPVIPAGSIVTGRVASISSVSAMKRTLSYTNGDFSPFHSYQVAFDQLSLPNGEVLAIKTTVSPGTAEVVHLFSNPDKEAQKRAAEKAKEEAQGKVQQAKDEAHDTWQQINSPGRLHRLKEYVVAQSPYRHQYLQPGTRFVADLDQPLDFGVATHTGQQLSSIGGAPTPDSTLKARLVAEVSSATATKGTQVTAVLTEPLYSPTHQLILPANSRLVGEVTQAQPARKLHHNGELRLNFVRIEQPAETSAALAQLHDQEAHQASQAMIGNVEGLEVDRNANIKLDEEGGAHTTDSKTRYLSTGLAVALAAAAAHPDAERGQVDAGGDPGVRTAAGGSGFRLVGALLSLAVKSTPVSAAFGAYGASSSIYTNFLKRGRDVVLPKDTPIEIGFGPPHPKVASQTTSATPAAPDK